MKEIFILKEAEVELIEAIFYYEEKQLGLGLDFESEIRRAMLVIQSKPNLWAIRFGNYRKYLLRRFPFDVWYSDDSNIIRIYAIAHQKRKPGYWRNERQT